jgi:type IV pilus biogenesis protein PilP
MPLTIGEISDMQAAKARAELLSKFGYTEHKPEVVKPVSNTQVAKTASPEKRRLQITALAVWGKGNAFQAETMVNGRVTTVKGGEFLAPGVKVEQVLAHTVVLSVQSPMTKDARGRLQPAEVRQQSLSIGKPSEIEL